jgi:hypothetical protein
MTTAFRDAFSQQRGQRFGGINVRLITGLPVSGGYGQAVRAYNLFPKVKPRFRLLPSGKMMFTDKVDNAPHLIELLNCYASKHGIEMKIENA